MAPVIFGATFCLVVFDLSLRSIQVLWKILKGEEVTIRIYFVGFVTFALTLPIRIGFYVVGNNDTFSLFPIDYVTKGNTCEPHPLLRMLATHPRAQEKFDQLVSFESEIKSDMTPFEKSVFDIASIPGGINFLKGHRSILRENLYSWDVRGLLNFLKSSNRTDLITRMLEIDKWTTDMSSDSLAEVLAGTRDETIIDRVLTLRSARFPDLWFDVAKELFRKYLIVPRTRDELQCQTILKSIAKSRKSELEARFKQEFIGWADTVRIACLLEMGVDPDTRINWGADTPLCWSLKNYRPGLVPVLLQYKADPNLKPAGSDHPLRYAILQMSNLDIATQLYRAGAKPDPFLFQDLFVKHMLDKRLFIELILTSRNVNTRFSSGLLKGHTPLTYAAYYGDFALARLLKGRSADLNMKCEAAGLHYGKTPLEIAHLLKYEDIVNLLEGRSGRQTGSSSYDEYKSPSTSIDPRAAVLQYFPRELVEEGQQELRAKVYDTNDPQKNDKESFDREVLAFLDQISKATTRWAIFGLQDTESQKLKRAYYKKALLFHTDKHENSGTFQKLFAALLNSYHDLGGQ